MDARQLFDGEESVELIPPDLEAIRPDNLWVSYDAEADLFVVYLNSEPVPAVSHYIDDDVMWMTPYDSGQVIGFQIERWEKVFVPAHPDIAEWWPVFKKRDAQRRPLSPGLIIMALMLMFRSLFIPDEESELALAAAPA